MAVIRRLFSSLSFYVTLMTLPHLFSFPPSFFPLIFASLLFYFTPIWWVATSMLSIVPFSSTFLISSVLFISDLLSLVSLPLHSIRPLFPFLIFYLIFYDTILYYEILGRNVPWSSCEWRFSNSSQCILPIYERLVSIQAVTHCAPIFISYVMLCILCYHILLDMILLYITLLYMTMLYNMIKFVMIWCN